MEKKNIKKLLDKFTSAAMDVSIVSILDLAKNPNLRKESFSKLKDQILDPSTDVGQACGKLVECAIKQDHIDTARCEIARVLKIAARGNNDLGEKEVDAAVADIMNLYQTKSCSCQLQDDNHKESADIQRMKHLLDIIDRHSRGELTSEDVTELKGNCESWTNDIEKLAEMIRSLNMDIVV